MRKHYLLMLLLFSLAGMTHARKISFSPPVPLLQGAQSDRGMDLAYIGEVCFAAWKVPGASGEVHFARWVKKTSGAVQPEESTVPDAITIGRPVLLAVEHNLYLFWLDEGGLLKYKIRTQDKDWQETRSPVFEDGVQPVRYNSGITAVLLRGKIVLGSHAADKDRLRILVCSIQPDGTLGTDKEEEVKGARSATYPFLTVIDSTVRFCWNRNREICFQDYLPGKGSWTSRQTLNGASAGNTPAIYGTFDPGKIIYIWNNKDKNNQLQYLIAGHNDAGGAITDLPVFLDALRPVAFCTLDKDNFLVAYPDARHQLYISYGTAYNPASWMADMLFPEKENYTLKDIVLPGAHDAGMSVLSAPGGKSTYTINECNTLTQVMNIEQQLNSGIRMFDLRTDLYQGVLYTKHAPSDCMEDAAGGGYGERMDTVLHVVKRFLEQYPREVVLLSFCHFCDRHISIEEQAKSITTILGKNILYHPGSSALKDIPLKALAGKVIVSFEGHAFPELSIVSNAMTDHSPDFLNYKRFYASTNIPDTLLAAQKAFFKGLKGSLENNDLVRLDWQLTQKGEEAAITCSQFQSEKDNLLLDGALLLTNAISKNKSIIDLAITGNRYLPEKIMEWIKEGVINRENKPNILYVDAAGNWITDFCISLNRSELYRK